MGKSLGWLQGDDKLNPDWRGITVSEETGKVIKINWAKSNLKGTLPKAVNKLTELVELDLSGNWIDGGEDEDFNLLRWKFGNGLLIDSSLDRDILVRCAEAMGKSSEWLRGTKGWAKGTTFDPRTGKIIEISWQRCGLTGTLPAAAFNDLTGLRRLILCNNPEMEIEEHEELTRLKSKLGNRFKTGAGYSFATNNELKAAVDMWCNHREAALREYGDISDWDVSEVTSMRCLFSAARTFNDDISMWNISKVTEMEGMFMNASAFNGDLSSWDVSNVTTMEKMFFYASAFNGNLSSWDVSNVTTMEEMFLGASKFDRTTIKNWDLSWKKSNEMFAP